MRATAQARSSAPGWISSRRRAEESGRYERWMVLIVTEDNKAGSA